LDGFDDDDDVDDAGDELQLDTASPAIDEDVPVTPPRPGTEPMDDLTSPLIGQMLVRKEFLSLGRKKKSTKRIYTWHIIYSPQTTSFAFFSAKHSIHCTHL